MKKTDLTLTKQILFDIIERDLPFRVASKNAFNKNNADVETRKTISSILGAELRHHIVFTYLVNKEFPEAELKDYALLLLLLANQLFAKKEDPKALLKYALAINKEENGKLFDSDFTNFLDKYDDSQKLIGEEVKPGSDKYYSLKYNTPEWLIGMWFKHFGAAITKGILKANTHHSIPVVRANTLLNVDSDELLKESDAFEPTSVKNILRYIQKSPLKDNIHTKEFDIFPTSLGLALALENVDVDVFKPIAIYQGTPSQKLYLEVAMKASLDLNMDVLLSSQQDYNDVKEDIKKFGLMKASTYLMESTKFLTIISNEVHTFFLLPNSTNFQAIRNDPDFFIHFKQDNIDAIINEQEEAINNALEVIETGGELIYVVPTLNNKEGHLLINKVVNSRDDLTIIEEKQLFPFDSYSSSLYFARILKGAKEDED